ncbi:hypothetical protein C8F04DRAFT_1257323 [Mycena alexandri]|uniref:Uncharacterized protein n=1 Tax=Mycena alexandri TaxID=1745969 RepID=A0AAD6T0D5_9AGAR|nr:hypothetical protein C8F04DRAFT_1257323 [Mycena alexandri]
MPDASTQTDLSLFNASEFKREVAPLDGKPSAPLTEKSLEYKREAIAHIEGKATGPPSTGMLQWLGKNTTRAHLASELDNVPEEELEARRKKRVEELMRCRAGYELRLRRHPYLHWRPPQANVQN